jgi:predicted lipoprotein with Yx(FWY)xxD motif
VTTFDHPALGPILVDSAGRTLYFTDQEADGAAHCVDECLDTWFPAAPGPGLPSLGALRRRDTGQRQLTYHGRPLYRFGLDGGRGEASGDNLTDAFDGTVFVWHAATVVGTALPPSATP